MAVDEHDRIVSFLEKPADPPGMPDKPDMALASMGIYVFSTRVPPGSAPAGRCRAGSSRDFGKDIIPYLVTHGKAVAHRFTHSCVRSSGETEAYWRDVGTLDAYWAANIHLTQAPRPGSLRHAWPIWTYAEITPPAKLTQGWATWGGGRLHPLRRLHRIRGSLAALDFVYRTPVHSNAYLEEAVVLPGVEMRPSARLSKVIVDRGVHIPDGLVVGEDPVLMPSAFGAAGRGLPDHATHARSARIAILGLLSLG